MSNQLYNIATYKALKGLFDLSTLDVRVLLVKATYIFDPDHQFVADLTPGSNEIAGAGYSRQALATQTVTQDNTNNRAKADADDPAFGNIIAGETISAAIFYTFVTDDSDSWLIGYVDTGGFPAATNGAPVSMTINTEGWLQGLRL